MKTVFRLLLTGALVAAALPAFAQDDREPIIIHPSTLKTHYPELRFGNGSTRGLPASLPPSSPAPGLPIWQYTLVSPRDGRPYVGSIVGGNPFNRGVRTTTVQVVLIPLRIHFTGVVRTFDPTSPDAGCLGAGNTALTLTEQSPIFNAVPNFTMNGVNLGTVTFPDAFQRASFWSLISAVAPAYHLVFNTTLKPTQTISLANNVNGSGASYSVLGDCSTNTQTQDNPRNRLGVVDINFIDPQLNTLIANLGLQPNQFPLFLVYGIVMSDGPPGNLLNNCCILGYHNGSGNPVNPGQTYGIAEFDKGRFFSGTSDISAVTHEIMEWVNDPSTNNLTPAWGAIGQVSACQNDLEVGDPLSGTLAPAIPMPNGFKYHPQELAFFSWFIGGPSYAAGGKYSSNGTFSGFAKLCPPGGTN